jgi:XTP/dITP diphosphohydrolase
MDKKITFITSNSIKVEIAREVLKNYDIEVIQKKMELKEQQSFDIDVVAIEKAKQALKVMSKSFIIDDSGIYINALNKFPGALLKEVNKLLGEGAIIKLMSGKKNRSAEFINSLIFCNPKTKQIEIFHTIIKGTISYKPLGTRKLGWAIERIFIPKGKKKTIAQFDEKEWQEFWEWFKLNLHYNKFGKWVTKQYPYMKVNKPLIDK